MNWPCPRRPLWLALATLRPAVPTIRTFMVSLALSGCGYLPTLVLGNIASRTISDAIEDRRNTAPSPSIGAGFVISHLSDPPARATAGASFAIREAILPVIVGGAEPVGITHYHLSLTTTLPLRADKRLIESRKPVSEGTVVLTVPDDTVPGLYRLVACPRELGGTGLSLGRGPPDAGGGHCAPTGGVGRNLGDRRYCPCQRGGGVRAGLGRRRRIPGLAGAFPGSAARQFRHRAQRGTPG